jgi:hypothetical protein
MVYMGMCFFSGIAAETLIGKTMGSIRTEE